MTTNPPAAASQRSLPPIWVQAAASCAALLGILAARRPEMFAHPQLWAEDGPIFFVAADQDGIRALVTPYNGYHHLLLRLVAAAAAPAPATWVPTLYFAVCIAALLLLAAALFSPRVSLPWKPLLALGLGLVPHTGEAIGNLTNLQWVSALGLVWLLLARDAASLRQHATDTLVAVVLGLTGIFSTLFMPLFLLRALHRRTIASAAVAGCVALAGGLQAWTNLHTPPGVPTAAPLGVMVALEICGLRLPGCLLLPPGFAAGLPRGLLLAVGGAAALGLAATMLVPGRNWWPRMALAGCAALVMVATMYRFRLGEYPALFAPQLGDRYFYLPRVCCLWLLIWAGARVSWTRWLAIAACVMMVAATGLAWRYEQWRDYEWRKYALRLDAGEAVSAIPLNPIGFKFDHPGHRRR